MRISLGSAIPEYHTRAVNNASNSDNRIHDDEFARRLGFRGGLVPGVTVYAYITHSLVEFMGEEWLQRGAMDVRFTNPIYEGEEVRVTGTVNSIGEDGTVAFECQAGNSQGLTCAVVTATLPPCAPSPAPRLRDFPAGRSRRGRPIELETLKIGERLSAVKERFTWNANWEYCQKIVRDHLRVYQRRAHPGWLLSQANRIFAENYDLPPWIHVSSNVQHFDLQVTEGEVETRGRVCGKFERKGHRFVVLDIGVFSENRCLIRVLHTAIFHIAPRAA